MGEQRKNRFLCPTHGALLIGIEPSEVLRAPAVGCTDRPAQAPAGVGRHEPRLSVDDRVAERLALKIVHAATRAHLLVTAALSLRPA